MVESMAEVDYRIIDGISYTLYRGKEKGAVKVFDVDANGLYEFRQYASFAQAETAYYDCLKAIAVMFDALSA